MATNDRCPTCDSPERGMRWIDPRPIDASGMKRYCIDPWHEGRSSSPLPAPSIGFVSDQFHEGPSCTLCGATMQFKCPKCGSTPACTEPLPAPSALTVRCWKCKGTLIYKRIGENEIEVFHSCDVFCTRNLAEAEVGDSGAQKEK